MHDYDITLVWNKTVGARTEHDDAEDSTRSPYAQCGCSTLKTGPYDQYRQEPYKNRLFLSKLVTERAKQRARAQLTVMSISMNERAHTASQCVPVTASQIAEEVSERI